jgi:AraC-like DNA-binding protein
MVRVATLAAALPVLRHFGVDVARTLAEFGLQESYFDEPDNTIPYSIVGLVLRRSSEITRCPHFSLLAGQRLNASALGVVGFLMRSAPDVRSALNLLSRYFRFHNPNATIDIVDNGAYTAFRFTLLQPTMEGRDQLLDGVIANAYGVMRQLCGRDWTVTEVRLARTVPPDVRPYRSCFGTTPRFNAAENAIVFSSRWMDSPLSTADAPLHQLMMKRIRELEVSYADDLADQVRRMLPPLIAARTASVDVVANLVGLPARTLNRRLAAQATTYVRLRDEARHSIAMQLLKDTDLSANEISDRLGYANSSAFTRAFARWTGKAPVEWRASREGGPLPAHPRRSGK